MRLFLIALGSSFVLGIVASAALVLPLVLAFAAYGYVSLRLRARPRNGGRDVFSA